MTTFRPLVSIVLTGLTVTLAACGSDSPAATTTSTTSTTVATATSSPASAATVAPGSTVPGRVDKIEGIWDVSSIDGKALPQGVTIRLDFGTKERVSIRGACNQMNASYTIAEGLFIAAQMTSTKMACDQSLMDLDDQVATLLAAQPQIVPVGGALTFKGPRSEALLIRADDPAPAG